MKFWYLVTQTDFFHFMIMQCHCSQPLPNVTRIDGWVYLGWMIISSVLSSFSISICLYIHLSILVIYCSFLTSFIFSLFKILHSSINSYTASIFQNVWKNIQVMADIFNLFSSNYNLVTLITSKLLIRYTQY